MSAFDRIIAEQNRMILGFQAHARLLGHGGESFGGGGGRPVGGSDGGAPGGAGAAGFGRLCQLAAGYFAARRIVAGGRALLSADVDVARIESMLKVASKNAAEAEKQLAFLRTEAERIGLREVFRSHERNGA